MEIKVNHRISITRCRRRLAVKHSYSLNFTLDIFGDVFSNLNEPKLEG